MFLAESPEIPIVLASIVFENDVHCYKNLIPSSRDYKKKLLIACKASETLTSVH